jgi:hypothetical protein
LLNADYDRTVVAAATGDFRVPAQPRAFGVEAGLVW